MTTDTMRQKFEEDLTLPLLVKSAYPSDEEIELLWYMYEKAYTRGRKDLIEVMKPAAIILVDTYLPPLVGEVGSTIKCQKIAYFLPED